MPGDKACEKQDALEKEDTVETQKREALMDIATEIDKARNKVIDEMANPFETDSDMTNEQVAQKCCVLARIDSNLKDASSKACEGNDALEKGDMKAF